MTRWTHWRQAHASKRQRSSPYVKSPPRSNQNTYISSCRVCKPALNFAISAVPSRSHCSYSPHDYTLDQLTIYSHAANILSTLNSKSAKVNTVLVYNFTLQNRYTLKLEPSNTNLSFITNILALIYLSFCFQTSNLIHHELIEK